MTSGMEIYVLFIKIDLTTSDHLILVNLRVKGPLYQRDHGR